MDYRSYDNCHGKVNVFGTDGHEDGVVGTDEDGNVDGDREAVTMTTIEKRERRSVRMEDWSETAKRTTRGE